MFSYNFEGVWEIQGYGQSQVFPGERSILQAGRVKDWRESQAARKIDLLDAYTAFCDQSYLNWFHELGIKYKWHPWLHLVHIENPMITIQKKFPTENNNGDNDRSDGHKHKH